MLPVLLPVLICFSRAGILGLVNEKQRHAGMADAIINLLGAAEQYVSSKVAARQEIDRRLSTTRGANKRRKVRKSDHDPKAQSESGGGAS